MDEKKLKSRAEHENRLESPALDKKMLESYAEVRIIVATLIAGVTFAAGLNVPGGNDNSQPDAGITTLLNKPMYDIFVICNSIAMYNSIIVVVILIWAQIDDSHAMFRALGMTRLPLLIALATMSVAFMAGVYVTISKRIWLAVVTLVIGITALFIILVLYITLFIPLRYKCRLVQLLADNIIRAAILFSRRESVPEGTSLVHAVYPEAPPSPYYPPVDPEPLCPRRNSI